MTSNLMEDGITMTELLRVLPRAEAVALEQRHARGVRFDPARRVIDVKGYALDLDEARNAAELLDWLLQIAPRGDAQLLRDVVDELEDACQAVFGMRAQGVYCPWGEARVVDWRRGVTRPEPILNGGKE